jgi:hypothetical protein
MSDDFKSEWDSRDKAGLFMFQFYERKNGSALLYISKYLDSIPCFDSHSNYMIVSSKNLNLLGDHTVTSVDIYFWIGAKSMHYERNYKLVVECVDYVKGHKNVFIEHQYNESLPFLSNFRRMTKDAKQHFFGVQYIDSKEIDIMPKVLTFEMINARDETSKEYFRVYESSQSSDTPLHPTN